MLAFVQGLWRTREALGLASNAGVARKVGPSVPNFVLERRLGVGFLLDYYSIKVCCGLRRID